MSIKTKRITSLALRLIIILVLVTGGIMKLIGAEPESVMQFLSEAGFGNFIIPVGLTGLIIAALLAYPITRKIGIILAASYFGGALALEISGAQPPVSALFLSLLWISMFFGSQEMILPITEKADK